uniref:Uncharacterized protein n=1 Tax=Rhizophora mucronata TaxID=61149 RepID=A0A2P2QG57_RHIMU
MEKEPPPKEKRTEIQLVVWYRLLRVLDLNISFLKCISRTGCWTNSGFGYLEAGILEVSIMVSQGFEGLKFLELCVPTNSGTL